MSEPEQRDDTQLLAAIAAGDMPAMTAFYRRHESRVYRFVLSKLNDSFAAADILNDVMMEVWKSAGRFAGRSKVTTWLLGIANHKVLDHWRRKGAREFTELNEHMADESPAANIEQTIDAASDGKLLHLCMNRLSAEHREVLHLVFFEELGYTDIAGIINVPEGTVKSRVFHAKDLLKKQLAKAVGAP